MAAACVCAVITSINMWLFKPLSPVAPDISEYEGSEYYSVIEKINSFYAEHPDGKNNYLILANRIYNYKHKKNRIETQLYQPSKSLNYQSDRERGSSDDLLHVRGDYAFYISEDHSVYSYILDGKDTRTVSSITLTPPPGYEFENPYHSEYEAFLSEDGNLLTVWKSCVSRDSSDDHPYTVIYSIDVSDPFRMKLVGDVGKRYFVISGDCISARLSGDKLLLVSGFYPERDFSDPYNFLPFYNNGGEDVFVVPACDDITDRSGKCMITSVYMVDTRTLSLGSLYSAIAYADTVYVSENNVYLSYGYTGIYEDDSKKELSVMTDVAVIRHSGGAPELKSVFSLPGTVSLDPFSFSEEGGILRAIMYTFRVSYSKNVTWRGISKYTWESNERSVSLYCIDPASGAVLSSLDNFIQHTKEPYFSPTVSCAHFEGDKLYFIGAHGSDWTSFFCTVDLSDINNLTYVISDSIDVHLDHGTMLDFGDDRLIALKLPENYYGYTSLYVLKEGEGGKVELLAKSNALYYYGRNVYPIFIDRENALFGFITSSSDGNRDLFRYVILSFDGQALTEVFTSSSQKVPSQSSYNSAVFDSLRVHVSGDFIYIFLEDNFYSYKLS